MSLSSCAEERELRGVDAWWKQAAKQSERQKGSFVALWTAEFFREPSTLTRKQIGFRNDCTHKGRIPTESEAKEYGEAVLRAEIGGIVALRNCFNDQLEYDDFVEHHMILPGADEPVLMSFGENSVISGMWRRNEPGPDEDEPRVVRVLKLGIKTKGTRPTLQR